MNLLPLNKNRLIERCIVISLFIFCSSCASNQEFIKYTSDQISALKKTTAELQDSTSTQMATINSSQANILVEIESLKKDLRELSGRIEDNEHLIKYNLEKELGEKGTKTDLGTISERLDRLEKTVNYHHKYLNLEPLTFNDLTNEDAVTSVESDDTPAVNSTAGVEKSRDVLLYESSRDLFNNEKYEQALSSFESFLDIYPKSDLADNAQYWIAECYMGLEQYEHAILEFNKVIKNYPKENKVPHAMYRQAIAMQMIGETTGAKIVLKNLIKTYPNSPEAADAEKKLSAMK